MQISIIAIWALFLPLLIAKDLSCPTIGTTAYIFTTIRQNVDINGFIQLLSFYSKLMPRNETIEYHFFFGLTEKDTVTTTNIQEEVGTWIQDENYLTKIYNASLVYNADFIQYDHGKSPLSSVIDNIFTLISQQNQQPITVVLKKQVLLLTDYIQVNVTEKLNNETEVNVQRFGLFYGLNEESLQTYCVFPVYSVDDESVIPQLRVSFQSDISFQFPPVHEIKALADNFIFLTSPNPEALFRIVAATGSGDLCSLQQTRMYNQFINVKVGSNNTVEDIYFPWLGNETSKFLNKCITMLPLLPDDGCDTAVEDIVTSFIEIAGRNSDNMTFITLISHDDDCVKPFLNRSGFDFINTTSIRIVSSSSLKTSYESIGLPLINSGFLTPDRDHQLIENSQFYLTNYSTVCVSTMPRVPLTSAYPYRRPKYLHIALDDMLWITVCATICCTTTGCILYSYVKRSQKKHQELLNEIMLQPKEIRRETMQAVVTKLPWEIKPEKVHIDKEFSLGEGTVSNVYLGKLKGKAPIMQWIDKLEMKQYQDCAVAVRVPKHFDEPEEDQLAREIQSMRRLRHHTHIALLLGWTNKDGLICSLLELTHMNLVKYLGQIKETLMQSAEGLSSTKYIPYQVLYKIIWEVSDGMEYIHSRNLIHRDLTARNILLTTGLRAKISGFGFCSQPDDGKFATNSVALRFLPVRWMAPECFQGKFSPKSDIWSFAIMLYEIFTLGDIPYEDLRKPEDIVETVRKGRIPQMPQYASKETYNTMRSCLQQFPERRPLFGQLLEVFKQMFEAYYCNTSFEGD